jgi:hypothetical protein
MSIRPNTLARSAPLRVALLFVFVILSAVHPGLFATANATGFHADNGITSAADSDHHSADAGHAHPPKAAVEKASDNDSGVDETSCEVHCAPLHGVPADCVPIFPPFVGCAPEATHAVLQSGEPAELKRPPRP